MLDKLLQPYESQLQQVILNQRLSNVHDNQPISDLYKSILKVDHALGIKDDLGDLEVNMCHRLVENYHVIIKQPDETR